nr:MAG TPA: hypothetical protein [Caudoviricetes sp.]
MLFGFSLYQNAFTTRFLVISLSFVYIEYQIIFPIFSLL